MSLFPFPSINPELLKIQQLLSRVQSSFESESVHVSLSAVHTPDELDVNLQVIWKGELLQLDCHMSALESVLNTSLNGASFKHLPTELKLALLERVVPDIDTLTWQGIHTQPSKAGQLSLCIKVSLQQGDICFYLKGYTALIELLPKRTMEQRLPIPVSLSLRWGHQQLTIEQLQSLKVGDLLLLPPGASSNQLIACIQDKPFATFMINENHMELITMDNPIATESEALADLETLPINVSFEVGQQTLDLHTLSTLTPGTVLELGSALNAEVRILANQRCIATGELVSIQDRLGVKVAQLTAEVKD